MKRQLHRAVGAVARRIDRPELLTAVSSHARRHQHDEIAMRVLLSGVLSPYGCFVDVGANRGQVLRHAVRLSPNGRHVAFEAVPSLAEALRRSFPAVQCRAEAVGAEAGEATFTYYPDQDGWSSLKPQTGIPGPSRVLKVPVTTLDGALTGIEPELIKIDVEGGEFDVLQGAKALLVGLKPVVIFEHQPSSAGRFTKDLLAPFRFLSEIGYRVTSLGGAGPHDDRSFLEAVQNGTNNFVAVGSRQSVV